MEGGDYVKWLTEELITSKPMDQGSCSHWVNETVFLFMSDSHHIYFRLLAYYSIHKSLLDHHAEPGKYRILRTTEGYNYLFPEYERTLFPELETLMDMPDENVCFKKAVLVPKCYATIFFQCKMQYEIRDKCFQCNGRGLTGTSMMSFRHRVLSSCGLDDDRKNKENPKLITVILRKPYVRWEGDQPHHFERVLQNSDKLITSLQKEFPQSVVKPIHTEDLSFCEQVSYTHNADVLIGVHGAGLVHFWWLREDAQAIELEPYFETTNPTFRHLTMLTGRRYVSVLIPGSSAGVTVDENAVVKIIRQHSKI